MTGETLVENFGTSMGELWICQNFKKKILELQSTFLDECSLFCSTGETIWNYMGNHLTPELKPHCGTKAVVLSGRLPFLICIYP